MEKCKNKKNSNRIIGKIIRYVIAAIITLWLGEAILFHNNIPEWYWFAITLTAIMHTAFFGLAEGIFKKDSDWSFKKHPISMIGVGATVISGVLAIIQFIFLFII